MGKEGDDVIERKTPTDLILSARDRLWEQLKAMADVENFHKWLIIEGEYIYDKEIKKPTTLTTYFKRNPETELNYITIQAAIAAFKINLIFTKDSEGTAKFLVWLDAKRGKPKERKEYPLRSGFRRDWDLKTKRLYMLDGFGHETAKAIEEATGGSIYDIVNFFYPSNEKKTEEDIIDTIANWKLKSGRRIGDKKAKEIYVICFS